MSSLFVTVFLFSLRWYSASLQCTQQPPQSMGTLPEPSWGLQTREKALDFEVWDGGVYHTVRYAHNCCKPERQARRRILRSAPRARRRNQSCYVVQPAKAHGTALVNVSRLTGRATRLSAKDSKRKRLRRSGKVGPQNCKLQTWCEASVLSSHAVSIRTIAFSCRSWRSQASTTGL